MVIITAISVAAIAYASNRDGDSSGSKEDNSEPLDLSQKTTAVNLLPLERTLALFEAPIATITFMDGNPDVACVYLKERVSEIAKKNPWLGGGLAKDTSDGAVKLWYDETAESLAPGLFESFEAGLIDLTQDSPYESYGDLFNSHNVLVDCNASLIGRSKPLWRVSLVPDAKDPTCKFAIVVSMSHMCGDGYTFHKVHNMLHREATVETLDPTRKLDFSHQVLEKMGRDEAFYIDRVARSPLWARFQKDERVIDKKVFYLDEEWIEGQKRAWTLVKNMNAATALYEDGQDAGDTVQITELGIEADGSATTPSTTDASAFAVSFAPKQGTVSITTNDIVTSWFFRLVDATVGLMPYNFRNRLGMCCTDADAGNYAQAIPYAAQDYETPMFIQASRGSGKRMVSQNTPLPPHRSDNRYAISVDWRAFQKRGGLQLGGGTDDEICQQTLQLPCSLAKDLDSVPKSFSFIHLFNAGPNGEPAISVIAPKAVMEKIEKSGIVRKTIVESKGSSSDAFAESVQETVKGRRESVYLPLLNEKGLSTIMDDEE